MNGQNGIYLWTKRDISMDKTGYIYGQNGIYLWTKRDISMDKTGYIYGQKV